MADAKISADSTKAIPIAADLIPILDSAASNDNKKATLGSLSNIGPAAGTIADGVLDGAVYKIYPSLDGTATGTKVSFFTVTAMAHACEFETPAGTWYPGERLVIRIKDNGTARALDFTTSAKYIPIGVVLPTTTVISKLLYIACVYNSVSSKWDVLGVSQEV
jgi:hypothetical protein